MSKEKSTKKRTSKKEKVIKKEKTKRPQSAYNIFVKEHLAKIKLETPEIDHRVAFKKAAEAWGTSPSNPKNK